MLAGNDEGMRERGAGQACPLMMSNAAAGEMATRYGGCGLPLSVAPACTSAWHAVGEAASEGLDGKDEPATGVHGDPA